MCQLQFWKFLNNISYNHSETQNIPYEITALLVMDLLGVI